MCYPAAANEAVSHADLMLPMIHRRASDDKVVVRKAALQVVCVCVFVANLVIYYVINVLIRLIWIFA